MFCFEIRLSCKNKCSHSHGPKTGSWLCFPHGHGNNNSNHCINFLIRVVWNYYHTNVWKQQTKSIFFVKGDIYSFVLWGNSERPPCYLCIWAKKSNFLVVIIRQIGNSPCQKRTIFKYEPKIPMSSTWISGNYKRRRQI